MVSPIWRRLGLLVILLAAAVLLFFVFRPRTRAAFGPAVALCPGPDQYGYSCQSGAAFAYLDAAQDTGLYEDDGIVSLPLPFPFRFYGTMYTEVQVSSNGNLQFGNSNPWYINDCLSEGPVPGMGDMTAPFWDDLDLRAFGFLEYETIGDTPDRIFVIEWDGVPRFGDNSDDRVTFEVQLFETSYDIVFLYEDVATLEGYNGSSATIGLQSEAQGVALQYGCDQPVVANASGIQFLHPAEPNQALGQETALLQEHPLSLGLAIKEPVATLLTTLNAQGPAVLAKLRIVWLNQEPARASSWRWIDLTGNGRKELLLLWRGGSAEPELAQLVVLTADEQGQMSLLLDELLSARHPGLGQPTFVEVADLTHNGLADVLIGDTSSGQMIMLAWAGDTLVRQTVPEKCGGSTAVLDENGDDRLELWRSECVSGARTSYTWNGSEFVLDQTTSSP
jgi:hypothetical protein